MAYDEQISVASGDPFVVLQIGDRVRLAEKVSSDNSSVIKFAYTVKNSDLDTNGIGITATTGLSKVNIIWVEHLPLMIQLQSQELLELTIKAGSTSVEAVALN